MKKFLICCLAYCLLGLSPVYGQVILNNIGDSYSQQFTLPTGDSDNYSWEQGDAATPTLANWYYQKGTADFASSTNGRAFSAGYGANQSRLVTDRILSLATTDSATNRSLGLRSSGTVGQEGGFFGVRLRNNTGSTISIIEVSFTGQQWLETITAGALDFYYFDADGSTNYTAFSPDGTTGMDVKNNGTKVNDLSFTAFSSAEGTAIIDGTLDANSNDYSSQISGLDWASGDDLWLVWNKVDDNSILAIDDLTVSIIPEPQALPLFMLGMSLLALIRRRRS